MSIKSKAFGKSPNGERVNQFILKNQNGIEVRIIEYGGIITHLFTPDKNGVLSDIALGFDELEGYLKGHPYFGAVIGRYGNRICDGKFNIGETQYQLTINDGPNQLHGGINGLDKKLWKGEILHNEAYPTLRLRCSSKDGEEGFPGNISVQVEYTLTENDELIINYSVTTDAPTHLNLTHHSYFNLSGNPENNILDHQVQINADSFIPVNESLIPIGELRKVKDSVFDFKEFKQIGKDIDQPEEQIKRGRGYDHCFVLNNSQNGIQEKVATVYHPENGRLIEVFTSEPGIQFYTGNFLDGTIRGKNNIAYDHRCGFCLETQHFPDSPNQSNFPSTLLLPNETYRSSTIYKFTSRKKDK